MDDGLKQRLIGAVVLLALAVIFVPVIFDREQLQPVDRQTQIPLAPDIVPVVIPEPEITAQVEPAPPLEEVFLPEEPPVVELPATVTGTDVEVPDLDVVENASESIPELKTSAPGAPDLNEQGVPEAWVLQVASFKSAERASELQKKLSDDGYTAYTRLVTAGEGKMTRLFVGPKLDKARLLQEQAEIEEKFQLSTFILKFEP